MKPRDQESQLAELRAQYVQSLPEKVERIRTALDARNYSDLLRIAHQLHGSGKSYGFPSISDAGAAVEAACRAEQILLIRSAVALLEQVIQAVKSQYPEQSHD